MDDNATQQSFWKQQLLNMKFVVKWTRYICEEISCLDNLHAQIIIFNL